MINLPALEVSMHALCSASDLGMASMTYVVCLIIGPVYARLIRRHMNACAQLSVTLFASRVIMTMRMIWATQESNNLNAHPVLHAT